jgi:nicotinamidase/pyrazinamidase
METLPLNTIAFISVDNTRTFDDKSLNELYVPEWEQAAFTTKKVSDICKATTILTINVFDKHPRGHISFASSYQNKQPFDFITLDEVKDWTDDDNGLSDTARFTVEQLKTYLAKSPKQTNQVWPDHGKDWTESIDLMRPLAPDDFDLHIIKWEKIDSHPYGWFGETILDQELKKRNITTIFVGGVATDYCSGETASEWIDLWYKVYVITDAVRGVIKDKTEEMLQLLQTKGVKFIDSKQFKDMIFQNFDPEELTH